MKRLAIILALLLSLPVLDYAQDDTAYTPAPVDISEIRTRKGDDWFYVHKVLPKQTLYSICRAYEVTQQEVYEANREALETGLKAGMELLVPVHGDLQQPAAEAAPEVVEQPVVEVQTPPEPALQTQPADEFTIHRVKWYESLYSIARKYEITPESIIRANRLTRTDLQTGQMLKIPTANYQGAVEKQVNDDFLEPDVDDGAGDDAVAIVDEGVNQPSEEDDELYEDEDGDGFFIFSEPFSGEAKIALLLPFNARSSSPSSNYLDFYSGVLLALERIKNEGTDVDLKVFDLSDYSDISVLASDEYLGDRNFVIGPVMSADIAKIAWYCNANRIPLISPMDQQAEKLVQDNPYLVQAPVSTEGQIANLIKSMNYSTPAEDNVLVIHEKASADTLYFKQVQEALQRAGIPYRTFSYGILEGRSIDATLSRTYLSDSKTNHIIIASEKESFASDAVRNISLLSTSYDIVGYGSNRLRNFETIEIEAFQNVRMHFSLGYYVDYKRPEVKDFVFKYRAMFSTEPGAYAFQGYDLTSYFIMALRKYGKRFTRSLRNFDMDLMQSNMHFEKAAPRGGYLNKATKNIVYLDDYSIACE